MTIRHRSNESGIAMIIALFMMLALSVIGATLMTVAQTETDSSYNYRLMSQARYGGEAAIHQSTNYLLNAYVPPTKADLDPAAGIYDLTKSPVTLLANNQPVVLSSVALNSNYPDAAIKAAFAAASKGTLDMKDASVAFTTVATLRSMRSITDAYSQQPTTIQTWEISGDGNITGAKSALVEVASVVERQPVPMYGYAAFATAKGCAALSLKGGATTDSYDSSHPINGATGKPFTDNTWGNVGTNGNLTEVGNTTTVHGSLSTPRQGMGSCSANNVSALTLTGGATVDNGLNKLPQELKYPTPKDIDPKPPLTDQKIQKTDGCVGLTLPYCIPHPNPDHVGWEFGYITAPAAPAEVYLGNLTINAQAEIHLTKGTYDVNSIKMEAGSKIVIDSGPVIFNVAGLDSDGSELATPITITGQGIVNTTFVSTDLQIVYAGTGEVKLAGGDNTAAVVYAPNATANITGSADLYGAIIVHELTEAGGASIHYDRHLKTTMFVPGDFTMSAFTWKVANTN